MPTNFVFENTAGTCLYWEECKGTKRIHISDSTKDISTDKVAFVDSLMLKNAGDESGKCMLGVWDWKASKYINELKDVIVAPGEYYPQSELGPIYIRLAGTDLEITLFAFWAKNGEFEQQDSLGTFLLHKITATEPCYHIREWYYGYPYFEWDSETQEIEKPQKEIPINATLRLKDLNAVNYGAQGYCKLVVNDFGGKGYIAEKDGTLSNRAGWASGPEIGKLSDLGYAVGDELTLQVLCMSLCNDNSLWVKTYGNYPLKVVGKSNMEWLYKDNACLEPNPTEPEGTVRIRLWAEELCADYFKVKNTGAVADTPHYKLVVAGATLLDQDDANGSLDPGTDRNVDLSFTAPSTEGNKSVVLKVWGKNTESEPT